MPSIRIVLEDERGDMEVIERTPSAYEIGGVDHLTLDEVQKLLNRAAGKIIKAYTP